MELTKYKSLLKNMGKEVVVLNKRYRIVGIYEDSYSIYYIAFDGKKEVFTPCVFHYSGEYKKDNILTDTATASNCLNQIYKDSSSVYCYVKDDVVYAKELYPEPYILGYIFYDGCEYRFETEINITYNHKINQFEYTNPIYGLHLHNENYAKLKSDIKKAYVELTKRFLNKELNDKQSLEFADEFIYLKEPMKEKKK